MDWRSCDMTSQNAKGKGSNWMFWNTHIIPYLKGSILWLYISRSIPNQLLLIVTNWPMGRRRHTSFIHDTHEYHPKHASRPGLFICTSCLGGSVKLICASRPHHTKPCPNTPSYQTFHGGEYGILTCSYCWTTKTKRGLWRIGVDVMDAQLPEKSPCLCQHLHGIPL